nr:hypothetical protein [Draconibacterium orientale]
MKIGIITLPFNWNYGGILQNFALQWALKELGHSSITINRIDEVNFALKDKIKIIIKRSIKKYLLRKK